MQTIRTNTKIGAPTQYTNFNYTGMCKFNGMLIGAGPGGLSKLCCGNDDSSVPIEAYFIPARTNLEQGKQKRIDQGYLGFSCDGSLDLEIVGEDDLSIGPYRVTASSTSYQRRRFTPGHGFYWSYGSLKISNVEGSDFTINTLDLLIQLKTHGTK